MQENNCTFDEPVNLGSTLNPDYEYSSMDCISDFSEGQLVANFLLLIIVFLLVTGLFIFSFVGTRLKRSNYK